MATVIPIERAIGPAQRPPRVTRRARRRCRKPGCITILNRYHAGPFCYAHDHPRITHADSIERVMQEIPRRAA